MKIYELPCLLLLLLVFVGQVHHLKVVVCPKECSRDEETLTCNGITNSALPSLYKCVNLFPDIQVIDIRSSITCDCNLLYLTNHHVNPNLLVFAPVICPPDTVTACGFGHFKQKTDMVEIAGKMFESHDDNLSKKLDKHVENLVQKLGHVQNSKKRLQYIHAIFLSTKEAVGKLTITTTTTRAPPQKVGGVQIPRYSSNFNRFFNIFNMSHVLSRKTTGYVYEPHNRQEAPPLQVHVPHHGVADADKNKKTAPSPAITPWSYDRSYVHQPQNENKALPMQVHVARPVTKSDTPTTRPRPHIVPQPPLFGAGRRPFEPYYKRRFLPGYRWPNGHHQRPPASNQESWYPKPKDNYIQEGHWNLATTSTAATTTESLAEELHENDTKMKLIIFGTIIAFVVLVITATLIIINGGKGRDKNKKKHGDLDLENFNKQSKTIWNNFKSKMQVDYRRRETTGKNTTPSKRISKAVHDIHNTHIVQQTPQHMPQTNLLQTVGNDAAAVSGLTTAMAQQPTIQDTTPSPAKKVDKLNKMKPTRPLGPDGFQTRLIYRDNRPVPNLAAAAQIIMDKSIPKPPGLVTNTQARQIQPSSPEPGAKPLDASSNSTVPQPRQLVNNTETEEQNSVVSESSDLQLDEGLFASNLMKKDVEPTTTPVDLSKLKSKTVVDTSYGTPSSTDGQSDARRAVKVFQPKSNELGRGGRLMGVGDNKFFEVTCTFMDFQAREKSRATRKKKLARAQFLA